MKAANDNHVLGERPTALDCAADAICERLYGPGHDDPMTLAGCRELAREALVSAFVHLSDTYDNMLIDPAQMIDAIFNERDML